MARFRPMKPEATEERKPAVPYRGQRSRISTEALDYSLKNVLSANKEVDGMSLEGVHPATHVDELKKLDHLSASNVSSSGVIVIADGVEIVNNGLCKGNTEVRKVILPRSVKYIGRSAFEGCTSLESIELPVGLREIGNKAFMGCTSLKEVFIPGTVMRICESAFFGSGISDLEIAYGVRKFENQCFGNCMNLRNFRKRDIPGSVDKNITVDGIWKETWVACFGGSPCMRQAFDKKRSQLRQLGFGV